MRQGNRVIYLGKSGILRGRIGVVVGLFNGDDNWIAVDFAPMIASFFHNCDGMLPTETGYYVRKNVLRSAEVYVVEQILERYEDR